ncbi:MAG TPA: hypothetical protein DEP45_15475 [Armatimonadetes bacterium]|nr:hypothetical protein [Armatimonadota bacterium]
MAISDSFIEETREFWQQRTGQPVSREDAREAVQNTAAFMELLAGWEQAECDSEADVNQNDVDVEPQEQTLEVQHARLGRGAGSLRLAPAHCPSHGRNLSGSYGHETVVPRCTGDYEESG